MKKTICLVVIIVLSVFLGNSGIMAERESEASLRTKASKVYNEGNWKEAYELYSKLALKKNTDEKKVGSDLTMALECLRRLNRINEVDEFREKAIEVHSGNWRLLNTAAGTYLSHSYYNHNGYMVAGEFRRGRKRGGGKWVNSFERDRVRALQLMEKCIKLISKENDHRAVGRFYLDFADMLMGRRSYANSWRLGYLTDLSTLPDYDEGYWNYYWYSRRSAGAPVDEQSNPIFHSAPESWQKASTDGERWRWCLLQAVEYNSSLRDTVKGKRADFLYNQFGVQTMASYGRFLGRTQNAEDKEESGRWAIHTLAEDETIAKIACGVRRFKLEREFNFIRMYKELNNYTQLGRIFSNRRQYSRSAEFWEKRIQRSASARIKKYLENKEYTRPSPKKRRNHAWEQLRQIRGNWGMFEPVASQPAGKGATVEYRFRNGKQVAFRAHAVNVEKLIEDVKKYLKSNPGSLDYKRYSISNLGWQILNAHWRKYIEEEAASWSLELEPPADHWDRRITVTTPLQKPGAYLLTADMKTGNTCKILLWVADTVIVQKRVAGKPWYFVADAVSGHPVEKANVEFFGFWQKYIGGKYRRGSRRYNVYTKNFSEFTNANGIVRPEQNRMDSHYRWLVIARSDKGRLAYMGFSGVWYGGSYYNQSYNAIKGFVITDRPVYRPEHEVKFKAWVNRTQYDVEGKSQFAGQSFTVRICNPKGDKILEKSYTADTYGGFDGSLELDDNATLGVYRISLHQGTSHRGSGTFRVEEYKKPEFEVSVEAPDEPVMLGEKFKAEVKAKYYFGAPVTEAKLTYKVLRYDHDSEWYPFSPWDWLYGRGYWWYGYNYIWYPGWWEWGWKRPNPRFWWYRSWHPPVKPEVVAQGEAKLNTEGTFGIEIDSSLAAKIYGDRDHRYEITAEVTDKSRRTIVGKGDVLVSRKPFKVNVWVDRGYFRAGDTVHAYFRAARIDGKSVQGKAEVKLLKIGYTENKPVEKAVGEWKADMGEEGMTELQIKASQSGQYRLSCTVTDSKGHTIEGGYIFVVRGKDFQSADFRFNDVELVPEKQNYRPGEKIKMMINTDRRNGTVLLFPRASSGVCLEPEVIRLDGKSAVRSLGVTKKDMPNFFVEALTVSSGGVHTAVRQIAVPPEKRVVNVEITPSHKDKRYKPGQKAGFDVKLTDSEGEPCTGSAVVAIYDKSVEYISGGSNVPEIKAFFWKWRRYHYPQTYHSLSKGGQNLTIPGRTSMGFLGVFGRSVATDTELQEGGGRPVDALKGRHGGMEPKKCAEYAAADSAGLSMAKREEKESSGLRNRRSEMADAEEPGITGAHQEKGVSVRTKFADTALWIAALDPDKDGTAHIELDMPENLTTWKTRVWVMGMGTRVGQGECEVVTTKNVIIRLQAPRFFVQKDEVVLSANVHNYLDSEKPVEVKIGLEGGTLELMRGHRGTRTVKIPAGGEKRIDWRVKVLSEGTGKVTMSARTDEESDAMAMEFPVYVHGMLKTESICAVIRPEEKRKIMEINVPAERRPEQSRLEIRYSPSLAAACVDALPYLAEYPYGCTEQTLNRFLPTVITQNMLMRMGLDLDEIRNKRTNLNAQEIGDDVKRMKDWKRLIGKNRWNGEKWVPRNPVFDTKEVERMVKAGLDRLADMQNSDGGWGWFSGYREYSYPHTTAVVVHGLQIARENDVAVVPDVMQQGIQWLKRYQEKELAKLRRGRMKSEERPKNKPWKSRADALDAMVYMILIDEKIDSKQMRTYLYEDRNELPVYAKAIFGIGCHKAGDTAKRDMLIRNCDQYLVRDEENQTAYLNLPNSSYWWYWYGSEYEAHAYYLKLLSITEPKGKKASGLVKYLLNNRRHATYWNSTRDTACIIEAFADYIKASGEDKPDMTVRVLVDGKEVKKVSIDSGNIFTFDNKAVLLGDAVQSGKHTLELVREGTGPVYFNAYLTNFTTEDFIKKAGLEVKVIRRYFRLKKVDATEKSRGTRGQAVDKKVEKYERIRLDNLDTLTSGDLVEIELVIESKNDYEYMVFEDMKPAGFEPVKVRSGYGDDGMGAYVEYRDERVVFFLRRLARGRHSLSYRMRAEIPGRFSALPTKASAMYAPELKANSDEIKLKIIDAEE